MEKNTIKVKLTFIESALGTQTGDPEIYKNFLATKNPQQTPEMTEEELANLPSFDEEFERGITVFPRSTDDKGVEHVALYGYMLKGFFKNACSALREQDKTKSSKIKAYKKKIDNLVFVNRISCVEIPNEEEVYKEGRLPLCQRPLRAQTAQGERVALACSEEIPEGSSVVFTVTTLNDEMMDLVKEWLEYGEFNGLGCWHNAGKGRFSYEILPPEKKGK